ncbi:RING finger protein 215 isoform X2 [Myxocyprinus asiaticus]|uniref:RING finger protein 215 isoform X2 n=1 Tax=Myxocyprinus asiaticus TaxID=70543 RepID=UPI0022226A1B|nr:RING finger protein 215 isoform X2 [Myxocyprinus asiaticus]
MGVLTGLSVLFWVLFCPLVSGEQVAFVEVFLEDHQDVLQGEVVQGSLEKDPMENHNKKKHDLNGDLVLIKDEALETNSENSDGQDQNPWIGVVPVQMEEGTVSSNSNQESFAASMVNKMKRALVFGASALIILALNQNTVREMDLSQVLSKPIIVIQTSENVTKLIGALLRGLHATAKITYKTFLQDSLGATLTLWSSCGRSRSGLYGEWQGVICTGENNSQVQKYLQQLWNTVVLVALVLSTGVIVQARWQYQDNQFNDDSESHLKQDILKRLSALKTRTYRQPKVRCDPTLTQPVETDNCAVCLEQYNNNQCLRVLPCLHEFHRDCVDPWLLLQQTCPLCKRSVLGNFY